MTRTRSRARSRSPRWRSPTRTGGSSSGSTPRSTSRRRSRRPSSTPGALSRPWAHGRLNVVERILLASRLEGERPATARHASDLLDVLARDIETENRLFRTALQGSALDTDDALGFAAAAQTVREERLDVAKS